MHRLQQCEYVESCQHLAILIVPFLSYGDHQILGVLEELIICELEELLEQSLEVLILHSQIFVE